LAPRGSRSQIPRNAASQRVTVQVIMGLDIHGWIEITYASDGDAQDDTMWMGVTHLAPLVDECPNGRRGAPAGQDDRASSEVGPWASGPMPMQTDHHLGVYDDQGRTPVSPGVSKQRPKQSTSPTERWTLDRAFEHRQLLTEGQVLKRDRAVPPQISAKERSTTTRGETRRFVAWPARGGAAPRASGRVGAASGPPVGVPAQ